jgi:hypothetical protein
MSYQEKRTIVSVLTGIAVLTAYCIYAFGQAQAINVAPTDLKYWARVMLIFIGIGVGASIVIQIVFHILLSIGLAVKKTIENGTVDDKVIEQEIGSEIVEDEMDKLIELKSTRVGFVVAGVGFVGALLALILDYSPAVMLNVLFISFCAGSILEGFAQLYYYRRGIRHA